MVDVHAAAGRQSVEQASIAAKGAQGKELALSLGPSQAAHSLRAGHCAACCRQSPSHLASWHPATTQLPSGEASAHRHAPCGSVHRPTLSSVAMCGRPASHAGASTCARCPHMHKSSHAPTGGQPASQEPSGDLHSFPGQQVPATKPSQSPLMPAHPPTYRVGQVQRLLLLLCPREVKVSHSCSGRGGQAGRRAGGARVQLGGTRGACLMRWPPIAAAALHPRHF